MINKNDTDQLDEDIIRAIEDVENGRNLIGPFDNMEDFWSSLNTDDDFPVANE